MDPFTARMLERARDRQRRVDERTGAPAAPAAAPARSPLRTGAVTNSEPSGPRQTEKSASPRRAAAEKPASPRRPAVEKSASPRRPAADRRQDKENHPNSLHESTRSRLKQLGSLYSTDGETDLDAYDVEVTPRHARRAEPEPEPPSHSLASSSASSCGLRNRLAGLATQYEQLESEEMQGFTPSGSGSRTRLVFDFSDEAGRSRSPSPPRVVSAVTKPPSPEKTAAALPYRSASPVRYSPPQRPQLTGAAYSAPVREWSPDRQGSPTRQPSPMRQGSPIRQPSPVRGRLVQERAAVFDRPASPPPPDVDPTELKLSDRRKLFEKGQAPKVIARFGTPVTPHMLRKHAAAEGPAPARPRSVAEPPRPMAARPVTARPLSVAEPPRPRPALEETRSRSPVRQPAAPPAGPPSPSRAVGESTFQAHRKLWESMNNDWRSNEIAQSSRQQREKEMGMLTNRWQQRPAEMEQEAVNGRPMEEMATPAAPSGGIPAPPPPPPPPASPPARRAFGDGSFSPSRQTAPARQTPAPQSPARQSPSRQSPARQSPSRQSPSRRSPSRFAEPAPQQGQSSSSGESASSPGSAVYRGAGGCDESTVSYASGLSDAESLGAEILAMARANQPPPSLPTIDESSADSSSDMSGMAACAAIDDVLDDMDADEEEPTPPKRTRTTPLRRCISQPTAFTIATASTAASASASATTAASASASASASAAAGSATAASAASPSVAQLVRQFQCPPVRPASAHLHRRSAPCLGARPAVRASSARPAAVRTSTPRRSMSVASVPSADVTAVLPGAGGGWEEGLAGGDYGSTETLTDKVLAEEDLVRHELTFELNDTVSVPDLTFDLTDPTSARPDLTFDLTNATPARLGLPFDPPDATPARPDLTFAPTDATPVPPDLGSVSWSGRSPRCWEEPSGRGGDAGGGSPRMPGSRLRQYLFGTPSSDTEADKRPRPSLTEARSRSERCYRDADATELEDDDDSVEIELCIEEFPGEIPETGRGAGEGSLETSWSGLASGAGDMTVSDIVSQLEAVCLRRGGGDGEAAACAPHPDHPTLGLPPSVGCLKQQRQNSGVFRTPMACVKSPEQDASLPSVVLDGDGAEVPLMHSVSFYRRQRPQEVQVTPVRQVVRNREVAPRHDEVGASSQQQQRQVAASTQERVKQLQNEATQQMSVMSQASRALNLCNSTIEFTGSAEMVEAERLLLVATHRRQAALSEIQRLKTEGAMRQQGIVRPASRGSLSVSSVTLPVKTSFVREVAAGAANYVYYFVVLLRYRGQVIATQMLSSEDSIKGNAINFPNLVSFRELEAEFCVALEVYGLQTQREVLPHNTKYHIRKDRTKTPKKLLKHQSSLTSPAIHSPAGPGAVRATCFQLMGFLHLTARNLVNNAWVLEKVPSTSPLDGGVLMTVTCHADCAVEERGFITVFDDVSGFGAWHRRWAALSAGRLSFWKYPEDEGRAPPSTEVDLRRCVTERVGAVPRDICARQNTLLLGTVRQARPEDADSLVMERRGALTRIRHLLSLDGKDERQLWADKLNETLANIRAWDPDAMQPHLDPSA